MDNWYYDLNEIKNSPSFKDGIDNTTESKSRTEAAKFISKLGQLMKLRYMTIATATVYMHRFYMHHSFKAFHRNAVATACLFLAGKVEETPKKARDFFKTIQANSLIPESSMSSVFGADPKEELMTMERILLKTIKFDLQVDHPYKFVIKYAKTFVGERSRIEKVVQNCWGFINDSMGTTLCLQWEPEIVAIALMDLSCRITKYDITDWTNKASGYKGKWWDQFVVDVSVELLESICHQVLDLYQNVAPQEKQTSTTSSASSKSASSDSNKRPTAAPPEGSNGTPAAKQQRVEQSHSHIAAPVRPALTVPHSAVPPTAGPPPQQPYQQPQHVVYQEPMPPVASTAYAVPPPGYGGYTGQTNMVRPPLPTNYQHPVYYSQSAASNPQQAAMYYSQPPAAGYQGYPPPVGTNPYGAGAMPPQRPPGQRRSSSLKVLTDNR